MIGHMAVEAKTTKPAIRQIEMDFLAQAPLGADAKAITMISILIISATMLAIIMVMTTWASRRLGFNKEDEITIVFCGSKKSLASGVPMAKVLFSSGSVGLVLLPLMLFHQLQLMVCAVLAQRYAKREGA